MKIKNKIFNIVVVLVDILLINLGFYIAFMMKFDFNPPRYNIGPYIEIIPFITIAALLYFDLYGLLKPLKKSLYETVYSIVLAIMLLCITTIAITYINQGFSFPRSILLVSPVLQIALLVLWRMFAWEIRKYILDTRNVIVIGTQDDDLDSIVGKIKAPASNMLLNIKNTCDIADIENVFRLINNNNDVFISSSVPDETKKRIIGYCMNNGKGIYIMPDMSEILLYKAQMLQFDDIATFEVEQLKLSIVQKMIKRLFDIVFSTIALIIFSPVLLISAIAIKLNSKGPVFYSQERVTRGGREFDVYKFRTMVNNAEEITGPTLSAENDDRITSVGNFLRKTRIDELPQFLNVLKGDMSVVGPRPERPHFVEQFKKEIPGYEYRTHVKAGITGLAQVLGKYSTEPEDKLRYDLLYIRNYSILYDIKIILQTLNIVLMRHGAEGLKAIDEGSLARTEGKKLIDV
ncbi:MAG: sugar transferase [Ignavibacteriales bacterium]